MSFVWGREQKCEARVGRGMGVEPVLVLFVFLKTKDGKTRLHGLGKEQVAYRRGENAGASPTSGCQAVASREQGEGRPGCKDVGLELLWMQGSSAGIPTTGLRGREKCEVESQKAET